MTDGQRKALGTAAIVGGVVLAGVGVAVILRRRRPDNLGYSTARPEVVDTVRKGNRSLRQHYKANMLVEDRIGLIQEQTAKSVKDPEMNVLAKAITGPGTRDVTVGRRTIRVHGRGCPARDGLCEAKAVYDFVRDPEHLRYTGDIAPHALGRHGKVEAIDLFPTASAALEAGGEDCDGHAIVENTLLILNGIMAVDRVTARGQDAAGGDSYSHIYTGARLPKNSPTKTVWMDSTLPGDRFGMEHPYGRNKDFVA